MNGIEKRFVYILRSEADPSRHYTGISSDVAARLQWHNPWSVRLHRPPPPVGARGRAIEFPDEQAARRFEKYLKSGSGRAFSKRHFGA